MITKARAFAEAIHAKQHRWNGDKYITHVAAVVANLPAHASEAMVAAAWLHDTIEDSTATLEDLRGMFPNSVVDLVAYLTKQPAESYADYIQRVVWSYPACTIKLADLKHNLSDLPLGQRRDKYELAQALIERSLRER